MSHADFVHLRVHTAYSLSQGALKIEEAVRLAKEQRMPALAITDTGNLFGALEFSEAVAKAGIQPIVGCELALAREGEEQPGIGARVPEPDRIVLLAQTEAGYRNLMALSSAAFLETEPTQTPRVTWAALKAHADGLIALTGGVAGPVGRLLAESREKLAEAALLRLADLFPGRLYVELQRHGMEIEDRVEAGLVGLAYAHNIPLVATNEPYFGAAAMYEAHDALLCIADSTFLAETNRRRVTPEHRFKSAEEMRALFADLPEAIDNTLVIARRCAYMPPKREPILPAYHAASGRTGEDELRVQAEAGLEERLVERAGDDKPRYRERLAYEISVIVKMGFPGYFLVVADFIRFARTNRIPVGPGRGSGAGSVVAWALGITDLDPLYFGLLFERFLNPHRVSMPDFDIDFCEERRDEVINYVQQRYGTDRVAKIITFGRLQARAVLRDVGRVMEIPYGQVDRVCKLVPFNPAKPVTLAEAIEVEPRLAAERDGDERVARMLDIGQKLEGLYRHASTHAAGVVIGDRPLIELVPLYRDPRSTMPVTQFSMKYVEAAGLVKFDFLGLKTLTVIDKTLRLLDERGTPLNLGTIPLDDPDTYAMLSRGETIGVFQLESGGMRDLVVKVRPSGIEDIIAIVALFLPGSMENIPKYVACKHGREEPEHLHELIEPVVRDTYGVIIYQEQVMQIAQVFAGFSMAEADNLRRAMGKKIKSEMDAMRDRFIKGAMEKGVAADRATQVFDLVDKFAGYGLNKAHSAGYGLIAFQTAYLKAHYPVEFLAASMTVDMGNTDKLSVFKDEAKRLGIAVLPPDVNASGVVFTVEDAGGKAAIRYALGAIRNVGGHGAASLVDERTAHGRYRDLADLAGRLDPRAVNRRQLENVARAGGFDSLKIERAHLVGGLDSVMAYAASATEERVAGQASLFGGGGGASADRSLRLPAAEPWNVTDRLQQEREAIGFYLSAHPLESYAGLLAARRVVRAADIAARVGAGTASLALAGTVERRTERRSQRGSRYAHVACSDPSGTFEITVFSELLVSARNLLEPGTSIMAMVEGSADGENLRLTAQSIQSLDEVATQQASSLQVWVTGPEPIGDLKRILGPGNNGKASVSIVVRPPAGDREVEITLPGKFGLTPATREALARVPGVGAMAEA